MYPNRFLDAFMRGSLRDKFFLALLPLSFVYVFIIACAAHQHLEITNGISTIAFWG